MRTYILFICIALSLCQYNLEYHTDMVKRINKLRTTWTAKVYNRDITPLLGAWKYPENKRLPRKTEFKIKDDELPTHYDLRQEYRYCETIREIRDQAKCGSCWAFAAGETMSDRLCIHSKGKLQTRVSTLDILSCCTECGNGCHGGWPAEAFKYWIQNGIVSGGLYGDTKTCKPYFLPECDDHMHMCHDYVDTPQCTKQCISEYPKTYEEDKTYGKEAYSISGEADIMKEIMENGSVSAIFDIYQDFTDYSSGIYQHVFGGVAGSHAVKIIGWGVEKDVKYWIIANSWNPTWGENGYFRILRGTDECGIESSIDAVIPKL